MGFYDTITFVAIRNIKRGEELVFDYGFNETFSGKENGILFTCNCRSKNCRKIIRVKDWQQKPLQTVLPKTNRN
jgi:hypothetical protein